MRSREITKDEINKITEKCQLREKAFFTMMRQSGLTPLTIRQLKIREVEKILDPNPPIPCKIDPPKGTERGRFERLPSFIGEEGVKYLKQYLATRRNLTPESPLFTIRGNPNKGINLKNVSRSFKDAAEQLRKAGKITYEVRKGKPSELRLFTLVDFYRTNAKPYLTELDSNTPKDDESYRKLYEEKAMPFLEIETPEEAYKLKRRLQRLENAMARILKRFEPPKDEYEEPSPEEIRQMEENFKYFEKWREEHPEDEKEQQQREQEFNKWIEEHPEFEKQMEENINEHERQMREEEIRLEERKKILQDFQNLLSKIKTEK